MTDYLWPPDIIPSSQTWGVLDPAGMFTSPLSGSVRTVSRPGARLRTIITVPPVRNTTEKAERARLIAVLSSLRGRSNRLWVPDFSVTKRGSFAADELLTNNDFSNGTTGWTAGNAVLSVSDRVARLTYDGGAGAQPYFVRTAAGTQYAPHSLRAMIEDGRDTAGLALGVSLTYGSGSAQNYSTSRGLVTASAVLDSASAQNQFPVAFSTSTGYAAGAYLNCLWTSYARCIQVDNGHNALLYSDQFDNAAWTKTRCTASANADTAPDATTTADRLIEDSSAATTHLVSQAAAFASAAADFCFTVSVKAGTRTFAVVQLVEATGGTGAETYINLSTGALSNLGTGANWANTRAFVVNSGNGWYTVSVVARKTNAATSIEGRVYLATAAGTASYTGDGASYIRVWRASLAQSSVPVRAAQTVAVASAGTSQTGRSLYVKGLPASTQGLLRVGDPVQIGTQMNFVASDLDSDAAGNGLLLCGLPWRSSPADNDPVHVNTPMAKMILASEDISWMTGPGQFSEFQIELVEDVA